MYYMPVIISKWALTEWDEAEVKMSAMNDTVDE